MKTLFSVVIISLFTTFVNAQSTFTVPYNYKLKEKSDYDKYSQDIVKATEWLLNTPSNEEPNKRVTVNKFVIKWVMGSPSVTITLNEYVMFKGSPDYFPILAGAWSSENIKSGNYDDHLAGALAGVEAVIEYYEKNSSRLKKSKLIKKYISLKKKGKLKSYLEEKMK